jgi:hypothetical protein
MDLTVKVNDASYQVGMAFAKFVADAKVAIKSGKPLSEAVALASAVLQDVVPVLSEIPQVAVDAKADPMSEAETALQIGKAVYAAIVS